MADSEFDVNEEKKNDPGYWGWKDGTEHEDIPLQNINVILSPDTPGMTSTLPSRQQQQPPPTERDQKRARAATPHTSQTKPILRIFVPSDLSTGHSVRPVSIPPKQDAPKRKKQVVLRPNGKVKNNRFCREAVIPSACVITLLAVIGIIVLFTAPDPQSNSGISLSSVQCSDNWVSITAPWSARSGHASISNSLNDVILLGGRATDGIDLNDVWKSTDSAVTWTLVQSQAPWLPRHSMGLVSFDTPQHLLLFGGYNSFTVGHSLGDIWESLDGGLTWNLVLAVAPWSARSQFGSISFNSSSVALLGGINSQGDVLNDVWISDNAGKTWVNFTSNSAWLSRNGLAFITMLNHLVLTQGSLNGLATHVLTNPQIWNWTALINTVQSESQNEVEFLSVAGSLWLIGSMAATNGVSNIWTWNINDQRWTAQKPSPWTSLSDSSVVVVNLQPVVMGGLDSVTNVPSNVIWFDQIKCTGALYTQWVANIMNQNSSRSVIKSVSSAEAESIVMSANSSSNWTGFTTGVNTGSDSTGIDIDASTSINIPGGTGVSTGINAGVSTGINIPPPPPLFPSSSTGINGITLISPPTCNICLRNWWKCRNTRHRTEL